MTKQDSWGIMEHSYWNYEGNEYHFGDEAPKWMQKLGVRSITADAIKLFSGKTEGELDAT